MRLITDRCQNIRIDPEKYTTTNGKNEAVRQLAGLEQGK
ncbi:hypothetical protein Cpin_2525 [Chitinophaga pinensis DSM 2588]|uniref:Uncharacterized protein n=1 Tax=Chitinophaga pinensis (strain ATCC 43595 / DSM 2588 / LMG 13176 / NBRC 15968 / NCIMB 11800 / UQM 2034) TaxID=485918 RepID=A0A979G3C5_CHIPD|nr:hypothetical protein Cpin_2525 [Chitinophaga pinensis DSM 2588]